MEHHSSHNFTLHGPTHRTKCNTRRRPATAASLAATSAVTSVSYSSSSRRESCKAAADTSPPCRESLHAQMHVPAQALHAFHYLCQVIQMHHRHPAPHSQTTCMLYTNSSTCIALPPFHFTSWCRSTDAHRHGIAVKRSATSEHASFANHCLHCMCLTSGDQLILLWHCPHCDHHILV